MVISEIKQINSPYIKLIKDESELAVPIHLVAHEVIEKYENCNCFDTSSLSINGDKKQINFFNERIIYELHCEDENNIYVWQDVSFKQLKDIDGLCVFSDSEPIITRKEKQRKNQKLSLNIKKISGIAAVIAIVLLVVIYMNVNIKKVSSGVSGIIQNISTSWTSVFNEKSNVEDEALNQEADEKVDDSLQEEEIIEEPVEEIVEPEDETEEEIVGLSYASDNYKGKGITYVLLDKEIYSPKLIITEDYDSVASITTNNNGVIGINASAWNEEGALNYTYVDDNWISTNKKVSDGDPLLYANGEFSVIDHKYASKKMLQKSKPEWVTTGYKAVIFNTYSTNTNDEESYNRTFVGQLKNGNYIVGMIENASYADMIEWARGVFGYDINVLYNIDKGESCSLFVNNEEIYSGSPVNNVIVF